LCGGRLETSEGSDGSKEDSFSDRSSAAGSLESAPEEQFQEVRKEYSPWEDQERLGFFQGITRTVKQSLFEPDAFFSRLPLHRGYFSPLLYALIIQTLGNMIGSLWSFTMKNPFISESDLPGNFAILAGVLIPLFVFIGIVLAAVVLHGSLALIRGQNEDYEATFRVVCYSSAPDLFNIVPVVGGPIALIWKLYLTVVGLRAVHRISTGKAAMALVLPLIVFCGLIATGTTLIILGLGLATG